MNTAKTRSARMQMRRKNIGQTSASHGEEATRRPTYEKPCITSYTEEEILKEIGPAQGYTGEIPGITNSL